MKKAKLQEKKQIFYCQTHKMQGLQFFNLDLSSNTKQVAFCSRCVTSKQLQGKDLLFFDDLFDLNDSDIINNWPILECESTQQNLENILNGDKNDEEDQLAIVEQFIDELQYNLNQKLNKMKKDVLNYLVENLVTKNQILQIYNKIANKQDLKNSVELMKQGKQKGLQNIHQVIRNSYENKSENQKIIIEQIKKFQENQQFLQLKFPKLISKLLFKNIKLIKKQLKSKYIYQDQNYLEGFKDYLSQCTSIFSEESSRFKDLQFDKLSNIQFESLIQTASFNIQKNQQISELNKDNTREQNCQILEQIEKLKFSYQSLMQVQDQKESLSMKELISIYEYEQDVTEKYQFIRSRKDGYSQTNQIILKSKDGLTKIKQIDSSWNVQFFTMKTIDPSKWYTVILKLKPFAGYENSYRIAIGFIQKSKCNNQWLDEDSNRLYFANDNRNCFTLKKKGHIISENEINHLQLMRTLEIKFCLKEKFFQIADYPSYQNITQAKEEETLGYQPGQDYVFGIKNYSVNSIKILKFLEGFSKQSNVT
ncbi:hypothetical protein ABPG74_007027 [Tetrahymena malaccensis]